MKVPLGVLTGKNVVQFTIQGRVPSGASYHTTGAVALPYPIRLLDVYYALRGTVDVPGNIQLEVVADGTYLTAPPLSVTPTAGYASGRMPLNTEGQTFPAGTVFSVRATLAASVETIVGLTFIGEILAPGS